MCKDCGCETANHHHDGRSHVHTHEHGGHSHTHGDEHKHSHAAPHATHGRTITLEEKVLAKNDELASINREWLAKRGIVAVNLISSPGSGKTYLLEKTLERLAGRIQCAVITGDQETDNDARRLSGKGAKVVQIETHSSCHLDAARIAKVLPSVIDEQTRLLFVENIGNLVCPAAFDLGEAFKIALLSVTEGEDKPAKYPSLFSQAGAVVVTKTDLLPHLEYDLAKCRGFIRKMRPGIFIFELSAKTGGGMDAWIQYLEGLVH